MTVPFIFQYSPTQSLGYTFLELCEQLIIECGISGSITTTLDQTGEMLRVVNWIQQAWREIQMKCHDWDFMRASYLNTGAAYPAAQGTSFATVNAQAVYPLGTGAGTVGVSIASFSRWDLESFRCYTTTNTDKKDETYLDGITYDAWRNAYMYGALRQVRTRPVSVAISPTRAICLGPVPNGNYTIEADYFVAPQVMLQDADQPQGLQAAYHMLIVYKAMYKYASYEAAPDVRVRADDEYWPMFRELEARFAPQAMLSGALA